MFNLDLEIKSKSLNIGDTAIIAASSSIVTDEKGLFEGIEILKSWGLSPREQKVLGRSWGYLSGDDKTRLKELHPSEPVPLIFFARGGWGSARLLEYPQEWKSDWLVGYSDVTSILLARLSAGLDGGIHGPLITTLSREPDWSKNRLRNLLFGKKVKDLFGTTWIKGNAIGPLVAVNLTVASHLIGSKYFPNLKGSILILEDTDEAPYRIDRMLTQWRLAGLLKDLAGIGLGSFTRCDDPDKTSDSARVSSKDILFERTKDLGIPVIADLPVGHCCGNAALPLGRQALLNGSKGTLSLLPF